MDFDVYCDESRPDVFCSEVDLLRLQTEPGARDGHRLAHKKTADSPSGLSGKPLQVLQPLAENITIIGHLGREVTCDIRFEQ